MVTTALDIDTTDKAMARGGGKCSYNKNTTFIVVVCETAYSLQYINLYLGHLETGVLLPLDWSKIE